MPRALWRRLMIPGHIARNAPAATVTTQRAYDLDLDPNKCVVVQGTKFLPEKVAVFLRVMPFDSWDHVKRLGMWCCII